jgi:hypothetical protein
LKPQVVPEEGKKAVRRSPLLAVVISVSLILCGCASHPDKDKPGAVGVQMQSSTLAGSLQYGLKF